MFFPHFIILDFINWTRFHLNFQNTGCQISQTQSNVFIQSPRFTLFFHCFAFTMALHSAIVLLWDTKVIVKLKQTPIWIEKRLNPVTINWNYNSFNQFDLLSVTACQALFTELRASSISARGIEEEQETDLQECSLTSATESCQNFHTQPKTNFTCPFTFTGANATAGIRFQWELYQSKTPGQWQYRKGYERNLQNRCI